MMENTKYCLYQDSTTRKTDSFSGKTHETIKKDKTKAKAVKVEIETTPNEAVEVETVNIR
jgi:hypothetical protein